MLEPVPSAPESNASLPRCYAPPLKTLEDLWKCFGSGGASEGRQWSRYIDIRTVSNAGRDALTAMTWKKSTAPRQDDNTKLY